MATKKRVEAEEAVAAVAEGESDAPTAVELGEFKVSAINDGGAEGRLSDEKGQASIILRRKGTIRDLRHGATYRVTAELVEEAGGGETVLANVPADAVKDLPAGSEVVVR